MNNSRRFSIAVGSKLAAEFVESWARNFLLLFIGAYRTIGTTHLGGSCRFEPSCSEYAVEAIHKHAPLKAMRLIAVRVSKCRPGGSWGYDPVPLGPQADKQVSGGSGK